MRTVMYTWDLLALLRKVSARFRFTWNHRNHYREMGVYFADKHLCAAEQGIMADETKVEEDPFFAASGVQKTYWRRSWPACLMLICRQLRTKFGALGADIADRVTREARRQNFDFTDRRFAG